MTPFFLEKFHDLQNFQEGKEQALYFDAHVLDTQRRRHDVRGCRCRFLVRYDHDQSEVCIFFGCFWLFLFSTVLLAPTSRCNEHKHHINVTIYLCWHCWEFCIALEMILLFCIILFRVNFTWDEDFSSWCGEKLEIKNFVNGCCCEFSSQFKKSNPLLFLWSL